MSDALARIEELRGQGGGWGNIAKEFGFKLGPIVREAQRARQELRTAAQAEALQGGKLAKPERSERNGREARVDRSVRSERLERPMRPERPDRAVKPERPERPGR